MAQSLTDIWKTGERAHNSMAHLHPNNETPERRQAPLAQELLAKIRAALKAVRNGGELSFNEGVSLAIAEGATRGVVDRNARHLLKESTERLFELL